jgi:ribosomal protein S18 acetylase RimI-like enzyme
MDIRKAKPTEGYQIESLVQICAEQSGMMMIDAVDAHGAISKTVLSPNCQVYVALIDDEMVGVILGLQGTMFSNLHNMEVMMCVNPADSRMGVGSMLMEHFLLEQGWRNVYAEVVSDNEPIIQLLLKHKKRIQRQNDIYIQWINQRTSRS